MSDDEPVLIEPIETLRGAYIGFVDEIYAVGEDYKQEGGQEACRRSANSARTGKL